MLKYYLIRPSCKLREHFVCSTLWMLRFNISDSSFVKTVQLLKKTTYFFWRNNSSCTRKTLMILNYIRSFENIRKFELNNFICSLKHLLICHGLSKNLIILSLKYFNKNHYSFLFINLPTYQTKYNYAEKWHHSSFFHIFNWKPQSYSTKSYLSNITEICKLKYWLQDLHIWNSFKVF